MGTPRAKIPVGDHDEGRRLDRLLRQLLPEVPLGRIYALLRKGAVRVGGRKRAGAYRIRRGDTLEVPAELAPQAPDRPERPPPPRGGAAALPTDLAERVVFENEHLLALDKPVGRSVHGNDGLLARLRPYLQAGEAKSLSFRPGPLHRLDTNTGGIIVFPKTLAGSRRFSELLRERWLSKGYLALLSGTLERQETWDDRLVRDRGRNVTRVADAADSGSGARQRAIAHVRPLLRTEDGAAPAATLSLVSIETGRTHQIRAQAAAHGHPLLGDGKYGGAAPEVARDTAAAHDREPAPAAVRQWEASRGRSKRSGTYILHAAVLQNNAPDEIFPQRLLCAPPEGEARQRLVHMFGARAVDTTVDCNRLNENMRHLVYKGEPDK